MRYIEIDGKMYRWRDLLKLRREQRKAAGRHSKLFLNSKTTDAQNHRARLLHDMRNRRFLSESHYGGTFLSTP
jgi:hypothetical protein